MNMVSIAKELSFFLPDLPGSLYHACHILGEAKIDIRGLTTSDLSDYALVRMVVEEPQKATRALEEHGLMVSQNEVLLIEGSNRPGGISVILKCLSDARTNIEYTYTSSSPSAAKGLIILRVNPIKQAYKAIESWCQSQKPSRKAKSSKSSA